MKLGEMNARIDFLKAIECSGPINSITPGYETILSGVYAKKVQPLSSEAIKLGIEHSVIRVNFIIRCRKNIDNSMCISYGDEIYNIIGCEAMGNDRNYMLVATTKKMVT